MHDISLFGGALALDGIGGEGACPTTLWYGTAGYTQADFEIDTNFFGTIDLPEFKGYFLGAGVESQLRGGWGLRAEYRFTQFDDQDFGVPFLNVETSMHTARLALTYKWGREEAVHAPMK